MKSLRPALFFIMFFFIMHCGNSPQQEAMKTAALELESQNNGPDRIVHGNIDKFKCGNGKDYCLLVCDFNQSPRACNSTDPIGYGTTLCNRKPIHLDGKTKYHAFLDCSYKGHRCHSTDPSHLSNTVCMSSYSKGYTFYGEVVYELKGITPPAFTCARRKKDDFKKDCTAPFLKGDPISHN